MRSSKRSVLGCRRPGVAENEQLHLPPRATLSQLTVLDVCNCITVPDYTLALLVRDLPHLTLPNLGNNLRTKLLSLIIHH